MKKKLTPKQLKRVREYKEAFSSADELIANQTATIQSAIALRIWMQELITLMENINSSGSLTNTINNSYKLTRDFDNLAMEYGPYKKEDYINAVMKHSNIGKYNAK